MSECQRLAYLNNDLFRQIDSLKSIGLSLVDSNLW
jgi:hypothetical protein